MQNNYGSLDIRSVWIVTREFAHIAEAGGVKNVASSLAIDLKKSGISTKVFIPLYACTDLSAVIDYKKSLLPECHIMVDEVDYKVDFYEGNFEGVPIVFVSNPIFSEKKAVYVYTQKDQLENPQHICGNGHFDSFQMNSLFEQSVLHYGFMKNEVPQIIHCQDAATSLTSVFARNVYPFVRFYSSTKFIVTIHNAGPGYLQSFPNLDYARKITNLPLNVLKKGIAYYNPSSIEPFLLAATSSVLTTVSPWYARELYDTGNQFCLLARDFIENQINVIGITNGIDYENYDPLDKKVSTLEYEFSPIDGDFEGKYKCRSDFFELLKKDYPSVPGLEVFGNLSQVSDSTTVFVYQGRMVSQKGIEVLSEAAERILSEKRDVCFIVHGQGQTYLECVQAELGNKYSGRFIYLKGYDRKIARTSVAVSDFLLLPSLFEPCCLEDFIGQIYGTIPIAHAVGGLNKIIDGQTGFLYENNSSNALYIQMMRCIDMMKTESEKIKNIRIQAARSVRDNFSWQKIIEEKYI
nr:glycogen/starch synthase [Treponemataceae bacterium]